MVQTTELPDASWWQIAWDGESAEGVIARLMYGTHYVDPRGIEFIEQCIAAEKPFGAYQYVLIDQPPRAQVEAFLDLLFFLAGDRLDLLRLGAWGDLEGNRGLQRETVDGRFRVYLTHGWDFINGRLTKDDWGVYTRKTFFDPYCSTNSWYAQWALWAAHYFNSPDNDPWIPTSWASVGKKQRYHQWTQSATGGDYGFASRHLDLNKGVLPPPPTDPEELTAEEMLEILWREAGTRNWNLTKE